MHKIAINIFSFLLILCNTLHSQIVEGYIYDENNVPLVGANIYLLNTNLGTASNSDGFFLIKAEQGENTIIFSYIGFQSDTIKISLRKNETIKKNIILKESILAMPVITVFANELNQAGKIIQTVIENKNNYLNKLKCFSYVAYTKTVLLVPTNDTLRYGGITETISKGFFKQPDKFQEIILAAKRTKNITSVHNIFSLGKIPNVLEEYLIFDNEKIISPLNSNALYYYSYDIIDTTFLSDRRVFNIKFTPKNTSIPLFYGRLSILDMSFVPVKVELYGRNNIITNIRKNIEIRQQFREYEKEFWLPTEVIYNSIIDMGLPGFPPVHFNQKSLVSNYNINDKSCSHVFDKYLLKQNMVPNECSDSLWKSTQIIPLTNKEKREYSRIDSVISNANIFTKLAIGITQSLTSISSLPFTSLNDFYHFNRIEGNYLGIGLDSKNFLEPFVIKTKVGYGFSDKKFKYNLSLKYHLKSAFIPFIEIYNKLMIIDRFYDYHIFDITYQSLFFKNDYADYFYSKGITVGLESNLCDYVRTDVTFSHDIQDNAFVNTNFSFFNKNLEYRDAFPIQEGTINSVSISINYDTQYYFKSGFIKIPDYAENFTKINLNYILSSNIFKSDYSFQQIHFSFNRYQRINPIFNLNFIIKGGLLFGNKLTQYEVHLPGNYGTFANSSVFRTILNDDFIGDRYLVCIIENNFKNTLFNVFNIPFLKHNKYNLLYFLNWGLINNIQISNKINYLETGFGISNILSFFRVDFSWRLSKQNTNEFVFSISSIF